MLSARIGFAQDKKKISLYPHSFQKFTTVYLWKQNYNNSFSISKHVIILPS